MKIPQYRRIYTDDFEDDEQKLVEKLSSSINNGFDILYDLVNKKLTFKDNFNGTIKDITVVLNSSGIPTGNNSFSLDSDSRIVGLQVIKAINLTNSDIFPTAAPFVSFTQTERGVTINNVTGLQSGDKWQLTVQAYGS